MCYHWQHYRNSQTDQHLRQYIYCRNLLFKYIYKYIHICPNTLFSPNPMIIITGTFRNCGNSIDGQVVSGTDCRVKPHEFDQSMNAGFQCGARSLHRTAFYDAITGPTEFIISIVNSVKTVNMPQA